jgi:DNA-binding NarL/FixJ family response regulator
MKTKIILVEDHNIMREGLRLLLENQSGVEVIGEGRNGREAVKLVKELKPDIVVTDISMPDMNGMEATKRILESCEDVKVIVLSVHSDKQFVNSMLKVGASGYLIKDCVKDELIHAIDAVKWGQMYISPRIAGSVLKDYKRFLDEEDTSVFSKLTKREREVLQLIAEGKSTKQIAGDLFVSVKTIETHRQNIMNKLEIYNIPDLVKYAIQQGVIDISL